MAATFRVEPALEGTRALVFDLPGQRVNLLTPAVLDELREHLESLAAEPDVRGLIVASGKPGHFVAGADVAEIRAVREASEGQAKAAAGQSVYQLLANFPSPTCAAIDGACVGGGLELALACRYRLASDAEATALGLPEVRLGILPAFGGTTRLPRLIGLVPALDLLLTGRSLDAKGAWRRGLVDDVLPREDFRERAERRFVEWIQREEARTGRSLSRRVDAARVSRRRGISSRDRWLVDRNPLARGFVLWRARRRVLAETKGHYPAPLRILDVVSRSAGLPLSEGLRLEAEAAGDLLVTPESGNLTGLFFQLERAKRDPPTTQALPVAAVGVVGAGIMGGGIAAALARAGIRVRLKDLDHAAVSRGLASAYGLFERELKRGRSSRGESNRRMQRISGTLGYDGFARLDLVIEAVVEDLAVKRRVLSEIEARVPGSAILATNTSSLRLESLTDTLARPDRLIGLHFFNPVHRMPLVEVVAADETSQAAIDTGVALTRRIGKTPIVVRSTPGFLVNRILMPYLEEALRLFQAGVPIESLDRALYQFGMPLGPLALLDEIGLDVALKVAAVLEKAFPQVEPRPDLLTALVQGGRLGKKSGRGFYRYEEGKRRPDPAVYALATTPAPAAVAAGAEFWAERLLLAMINEACLCLEQKVVRDAGQVDLAMILGTGFPAFRGGLLRYADTIGISRVHDRLEALAAAEGPRFAPAALLRSMVANKERFRTDFPT